ncbi:MAG: ChuX/HutX family heme-like substrate-binding protein [Flavobacteriales bacterium]
MRLEPEFRAIMEQLEGLGQVMALTRNDHAVHERKGVYRNAPFDGGHVWLFVGADIDLRMASGSMGACLCGDRGEPARRTAEPAVLRHRQRGHPRCT